LRYAIANPLSYLHLFPRQPDRLTERRATFDTYKHGLVGLNAYLLPQRPDAIRASYAQEHVTILLGNLDYQMLDPSKGDTCGAQAQSTHRFNRGMRYLQSLDDGYGPGGHQTRVVVVPGVGHNTRGMLTSPEGRAALLAR
jgi:hypothetical protein